ncbi:hypothetical protein [Paraburkholderia sp. MM5482-R1]|uniref:hypothetical protein n=1 Tax=unclassified Paraburkholderia TaxID=2615204 RepID=UPI003D234C63
MRMLASRFNAPGRVTAQMPKSQGTPASGTIEEASSLSVARVSFSDTVETLPTSVALLSASLGTGRLNASRWLATIRIRECPINPLNSGQLAMKFVPLTG